MEKKIQSKEAKSPAGMVSPAEKMHQSTPVTPDGKGDAGSFLAMAKRGDKPSETEEQHLDTKRLSVAATGESQADNVEATPQAVSAAQAEEVPDPDSDTAKADDKDHSNAHGAWWWLGGAGLAAAATGLGFVFNGNDGGSSAQTPHSNDVDVLTHPKSSPSLGNYTVALAENSVGGTLVQKVTATDPDGDAVTYAITAGNESGAFAIDAASGAITVADPTKLDFESIREFILAIQASDGSLINTGTVTIGLSDVNDNAPFISSGNSGTVEENAPTTTIIYQAAASDADRGTTITFSLKEGGDSGLLAIDPSTGAVTLKDAADFENRQSYTFTVIAGDGLNTGEQTVTVNVQDLNDNAPVFTSGATAGVDENAPTTTVIYQSATVDADAGSTITYRLKPGDDAQLLSIDPATGVVTLLSSPDFEGKQAYNFTIIADDGTNSTEQAVTVSVADLNDNSPVITSGASGSIGENAPVDAIIYQATARDADAGTIINYSLKPGDDADLLQIDPGSGGVTLRHPADFETKADYSFTVMADDGLHHAEQQVTVGVTDMNEPPVITSNGGGATASISVSENQTAVTTVTATDVDAGDGRTFSITGGADQSLFAIDPDTGVLAFVAAPDREKPADTDHNTIYDVQVAVTDRGGLSDMQDLAVSIADVREHVVVEVSGAWLDLNANGIRDGEDRIRADFTPGTGNLDLSAVHGVIHFNNIPAAAIDLSGFGADDRIEIDAQAFIGNGHDGLQILTRPNIQTLDAVAGYGTSHVSKTDNGLEDLATGTRYFNHNTYEALTPPSRTAGVSLALHDTGNLHFKSHDGPTALEGQLASQLPPGASLQQMVDFVHLPQKPATIHVVVERNGAVIDTDGDGIRDPGENRLAQFDTGGNADLGGTAAVAIHFNDVPLAALNLTGFGTDDKVEFDVQALAEHHILRSATRLATLSAITTITKVLAPMRVSYNFNSAVPSPARLSILETPLYNPFNGPPANAYAAIDISHMGTAVNGKHDGAMAYWTDTGNALNNAQHILPGYTGKNEAAVLSTLNSNAPHGGVVDFVWPENVVVDNSGAWIDNNGDGRRDAGETSAAGLQADLGSNPVTIHLHGLPAAPLDLSGFGSDDRLVLDLDALRHGNGAQPLSGQAAATARQWSDGDYFSGAYVETANGKAAVFLAGTFLKIGHVSAQSYATPSAAPFTKEIYTATGPQEGIIAINAGALGHHLDQVVFVDSGLGPA